MGKTIKRDSTYFHAFNAMTSRVFTLTVFLLFRTMLFGQQLLTVDSTWARETFEFPINFAPEIKLEGREEAVFPKNWAKKDSLEFWTYAFVWEIRNKKDLKAGELEKYLELYFDGLMKAVNKHPETELPLTTVSLTRVAKTGQRVCYKGVATVFEAFFAQKQMTLYLSADVYFCQDKRICFFRFSPQPHGKEAWKILEQIKLNTTGC